VKGRGLSSLEHTSLQLVSLSFVASYPTYSNRRSDTHLSPQILWSSAPRGFLNRRGVSKNEVFAVLFISSASCPVSLRNRVARVPTSLHSYHIAREMGMDKEETACPLMSKILSSLESSRARAFEHTLVNVI